jgi:hypothetical protein
MNQEEVEFLFNSRGYKLLSVYRNSKVKLQYECPAGHRASMRIDHFRNGSECPYCKKGGLISTDDRIMAIEREGYKIINIIPKKYDQTFELECPSGHKISLNWITWKKGRRCYVCDNRVSRITYDLVVESFKSENYQLLTTNYVNSGSYLSFICPNGHHGKIIWSNWNKGIRCHVCKNENQRISSVLLQTLIGSKNKLLEVKYSFIKKSPTLVIRCSCGFIFRTALRNVRRTGPRCPVCDKFVSTPEKEIGDYLVHKGLQIKRNVWSLVPRSEIDIVVPEKKIAIEFCGLYWHTELSGKRDKNYHLNKLEKCNNKKYTLITIFGDEYIMKKEIVKNILLRKLGLLYGFRLSSRICEIKPINSLECNIFLSNYHLQGKGHSSIKLGALYQDLLVAVMTFSKQNISKGQKAISGNWELDRFCSHPDFCIPGVASRLLSYFEKNYEWDSIVSFADRRWSEGDLYYKLNFELDSVTAPNYWYTKDHTRRIHRFGLRKNGNDNPDLTEWENRQQQNYDRIWDCGNFKFIKRRQKWNDYLL